MHTDFVCFLSMLLLSFLILLLFVIVYFASYSIIFQKSEMFYTSA